ncbi:MAG TPA: M14 family zinc carboxypeptidase [Gemmatimonadales bacterium]|nr:M14 family zinc carboxypeptidase [Gemmatimonadales bacterium]
MPKTIRNSLGAALLAALATLSVAMMPHSPASAPPDTAQLLALAKRYQVKAISSRRFTHDQFWQAVAPPLASAALRTEQVGRSMQGRSIQAVTFGHGPTTVLLWSQMHGDESTATMALADIFAFLADSAPNDLRDRVASKLTVTFVPMLNPDGAELFRRENAAGIDINRDAARLATPEGRILKALRDRIHPDFGFNLHDQNARTRAGRSGLQTAIALQAPPTDGTDSYNDVRTRAGQVAARIVETLRTEIAGRMAHYDDTYNPRAFGDHMQAWGTSTVLIESGALPDDPEKQRLRALNVAAILSSLDGIATGEYAKADVKEYEALPFNAGGARSLLIIGGTLVLPGLAPLQADLAIDYEDQLHKAQPILRDVGDLSTSVAVDTLDATGLFIHPAASMLGRGDNGVYIRMDVPADLVLRREGENGDVVKVVK